MPASDAGAEVPSTPNTQLRELLLERHGTLDGAFRWLDTMSRGRINMFQWDTGLRLLSLNNALVGVRPSKIFAAMDSARTGEVTLKAWRDYFNYEVDEPQEPGSSRSSFQDRLTGRRGARLLQNVRRLVAATAAMNRHRTKSCDDLIMVGSSLPRLEAVLEYADEEQSETMGPSRKAAAQQALMTTDGERAEELQLQEDLQHMELQGIKALAYILCAKCGSLDKAFYWMDCMSKGYFVRVQWETAAIVLHLDIEKLTGMTTRSIFLKMAGHHAKVSKKAWDAYFARELDDSDWEMLGALQRPFQSRAKRKLKEVWTGKKDNLKRSSRAGSKIKKVSSDPAKLPSHGAPGQGAGSSAATTEGIDPTMHGRSGLAHDAGALASSRPGSQPARAGAAESRASSHSSSGPGAVNGAGGVGGAGGAGNGQGVVARRAGSRSKAGMAGAGGAGAASGGSGSGVDPTQLGSGSVVAGRRPPSATSSGRGPPAGAPSRGCLRCGRRCCRRARRSEQE